MEDKKIQILHTDEGKQVEIVEKLAVIAACLYKYQTSADENERDLALQVAVEVWNHLIQFYQFDEEKLSRAWAKVSDSAYRKK